MTRDEFKDMEALMLDEVAKRRKLGGFDVHATTILALCESIMRIAKHLEDQIPKGKDGSVSNH
jgi:hypothetical protein